MAISLYKTGDRKDLLSYLPDVGNVYLAHSQVGEKIKHNLMQSLLQSRDAQDKNIDKNKILRIVGDIFHKFLHPEMYSYGTIIPTYILSQEENTLLNEFSNTDISDFLKDLSDTEQSMIEPYIIRDSGIIRMNIDTIQKRQNLTSDQINLLKDAYEKYKRDNGRSDVSSDMLENNQIEGLTEVQKDVIRERAKTLAEGNKFHDSTFLEKVLDSKDFTQRVGVKGEIIYAYGPEKREFAVGVDEYRNRNWQIPYSERQSFIRWLFTIKNIQIPQDEFALVSYLDEHRNNQEIKDIAKLLYSLGFKGFVNLGNHKDEDHKGLEILECNDDLCRSFVSWDGTKGNVYLQYPSIIGG